MELGVDSESDTYDAKNQEYKDWDGMWLQRGVGASGSGLRSYYHNRVTKVHFQMIHMAWEQP